jgi:phospholipid transport system substrate-binding protein
VARPAAQEALLSRISRQTLGLFVAAAILLPASAYGQAAANGGSAPAAHAPTDAATDTVRDDAPLATPTVEKLHATLLEIMKSADALGYTGRYDLVNPVVDETFDLRFMAAKSVGRHWKKLSPEDQDRWFQLFGKNIAANYAGQFTGFTGETFETVGEEPALRDTRVVRTRLTRPSEEDVQLNYRLREVDGEWRIIDIYLNGTVSELALRRSEYSSVLKREGFESLMNTIDAKCQALEDESEKNRKLSQNR